MAASYEAGAERSHRRNERLWFAARHREYATENREIAEQLRRTADPSWPYRDELLPAESTVVRGAPQG